MKPGLIPSSMFFLLVPFFISINIPTSLGADDYRFTNCRRNSFSCGRISNLKYPFWGGGTAEYCGLPDFQLKCEDDIPKIIIQSITYRILDLNWPSEMLTLARDYYTDTFCPIDYKNNTFVPTTFKYADELVDVTFLYDCTTPSSQLDLLGQDCDRDDGITKVYFAPYSLNISNCKSIIIPVQEAPTQAATSGQILAALDEGFRLQWMVNNEPCDNCNQSGGECGYDGQFTCFCREGPQKSSCSQGSSGSTKPNWRRKIVIGVSASVVGIAVFFMFIICNRKMPLRIEEGKIVKETRIYNHQSVENFMINIGSLTPRRYSYSEVKRMTKSFSEKLGQGGYGIVYKASLPNGHLVAVKVISESKGSGEEFINDVVSISRTSHVNIVTLLGYCYERNKRALIYEYMSNGSLDNYIHKEGSPNAFCALEWKVLYQIAIGIGKGLEYLHRGCNTRILHLDIKPQNILLDEDFSPKISDFGLAKICQKKESIVSILGTRGTIGFIAPEVFSRAFGGVSHKSDVYSYGMLVLEMIGGRKNYDSGGSHTDEMYFPDWIYKDLEQGEVLTSSLSITEEENEVVRKMTLVSLWCIQTNPSDRPAMSKAIEMLEGPLQSLMTPPKPSLQSPERLPLQFSHGSSDEIHETNSITM